MVAKKQFRILVSGLFHETHCFLDGFTNWNAFEVRTGIDMLRAIGDSSPLGGFLEYAAQQDWVVLPTLFASAVPGPIVEADVFERFWNSFVELATPSLCESVDAIFLILHGAFVCSDQLDVDGELLRRIRNLPNAHTVPIFGVYDLHANFSEAMATNADCLVGYRENPHTDARESAMRAASLLSHFLTRQVRPFQVLKQAPIILPPTATASNEQPMKRLLDLARSLEQEHSNFWAVNVNAGFAYADTCDTGLSFSIVTEGSTEEATHALNELTAMAVQHRRDGSPKHESIQQVFDRLQQMRSAQQLDGLTVLVEPSDNIGAGAPGNGTSLLEALIAYNFDNAAMCLWAPNSVSQLSNSRSGDRVQLEFVGAQVLACSGPMRMDCQFLRCCDGYFELEDKQSHLASIAGDHFDMGKCAIIYYCGITILLTSNRTPPMDLGQWRHVGLVPESYSIIVVKAAVAHRRAYDPIARRQFWVETPGPCSSDLSNLRFKNVRRPIFPLDAIIEAEANGGP